MCIEKLINDLDELVIIARKSENMGVSKWLSLNSSIADVKELLEKQIPKKPLKQQLSIDKEYTYYMRLRPPSPGCQPKDAKSINFNSITIDNREYWGSVTYDRQLTEKEICDYDLDYFN